jgi:peptidoglycan/LPS O-acetylase OafA/YrhL
MNSNPHDRRNFEIDILRGFAILLVIWHHSTAIFSWPVVTSPDYIQGWTGVELFFVISGYVVSASFMPAFQSAPSWSTIKSFYIKRLFRLAPICWFWLTLGALILRFLHGNTDGHQLQEYFKNLFIISTYWYNIWIIKGASSPYEWHWSLAIEEQFYLLFPFFLLCFKSLRTRATFLFTVVCFINFVVRPFLIPTGTPDWPIYRISSLLKFDSIMLGVLIYLWKDKINLLEKYRKNKNFRVHASGWICTLGLFWALFISPYFLRDNLSVKYIVINFAAATLVWVGAQKAHFILPVPGFSHLIERIGKRSYGLYLCHVPLIKTLGGWSDFGEKLWACNRISPLHLFIDDHSAV